ncbi:MAG: hexosyltransferase [Blastocatellia bacterium]|nr:MAG: hexosyltransferase [Blastocatellia bacterium]
MKLAVVVQRYGRAINGGAELHARYIAEHLAKHATVEVLTTCALDYVTWRNELAAGVEEINGVPVRRFRVNRERDPRVFGRRSDQVFERVHSLADELDWLAAEGPHTPALVEHLARKGAEYDYFFFFSYRYYHAYHGVRATVPRAILVPTAEQDPAIGLAMFRPVFRGVRALMYNSHEEQAMIHRVAGNEDVPGVVVGIGSDIPQDSQAARFRQKFEVHDPFAVYIGRIDQNKGCDELFEFFQGYLRDPAGHLSLVLIGNSLLPIPAHPRIRHLGFLDDADKFDAIAAADLLIMPSYFESLSMVALEAWALGRPVLANGRCDVLKGQCNRSNAGLYYESHSEFLETLRAIEQNRWLNTALGKNGRQFFREHYDWPVIERKYLTMLERLAHLPAGNAIEPLPGWMERRRRNLPPATEVVARLTRGASVREHRDPTGRPEAGSGGGSIDLQPRQGLPEESRGRDDFASYEPGEQRPREATTRLDRPRREHRRSRRGRRGHRR